MSNSAGLRARHGRTLGGLLLSGLSGCDGNFIVWTISDVIGAAIIGLMVLAFLGGLAVAAVQDLARAAARWWRR